MWLARKVAGTSPETSFPHLVPLRHVAAQNPCHALQVEPAAGDVERAAGISPVCCRIVNHHHLVWPVRPGLPQVLAVKCTQRLGLLLGPPARSLRAAPKIWLKALSSPTH